LLVCGKFANWLSFGFQVNTLLKEIMIINLAFLQEQEQICFNIPFYLYITNEERQ